MSIRKICFFLPDLRGGGAERVCLDLAFEFARKGYSVVFLLLKADGDLLVEAVGKFEVVDLGVQRIRNALIPLRRWLKRESPEVLIAAMWPITVVAIVAALGLRCKVVTSDHNPLSVQYHGWGRIQRLLLSSSIRFFYPLAYVNIGVSAGVARDLEQVGRLPDGSVSVVHNPIRELGSMSNFHVYSKRLPDWSPRTKKRILTAGSLKRQKNHELLIRAFARLPDSLGAELLILGDGELRAELQAHAKDLGVEGKVIFAGFQRNVKSYFDAADLFVLSSDYEGFGNVIVEALSCGTPVVSTDCPSGPAEILSNGMYGTLVPVNDDVALFDAMQDALLREHDSTVLRSRARDFSPELAADRYLALFL